MSFSPSSFPPLVVGYLLLIFTRYMLCSWRFVPFDWKIKKWHVSSLCLVMGCILSNELQVSFSHHLSLLPKQFWNDYIKVCFQVKKLMESSLLWVGGGGGFFFLLVMHSTSSSKCSKSQIRTEREKRKKKLKKGGRWLSTATVCMTKRTEKIQWKEIEVLKRVGL